MKQDKVLQVCYEDQTVGTLAMTADHKVAFQYSDEWLETGFSINPFSLPLQKQVFVPVKDHFEGLFGVFADSLPDHWGRLLLDRLLRANRRDILPPTARISTHWKKRSKAPMYSSACPKVTY